MPWATLQCFLLQFVADLSAAQCAPVFVLDVLCESKPALLPSLYLHDLIQQASFLKPALALALQNRCSTGIRHLLSDRTKPWAIIAWRMDSSRRRFFPKSE